MSGDPGDFWHGGLAELPSDAKFSAGPSTSVGQAFTAAYNDQIHNWSAMGLTFDFMDAEQRQLDAIYAATGQRMSPLAWQPIYLAVAKQANGEELSATDQEALASIKPREDYIDKLRQTHPEIPTYQELWDGVKARAQSFDQGAAAAKSREHGVLPWLADVAGRIAGSFTYRDPMNILTFFVGGEGATPVARTAADIGMTALSEAVNQFTGVDRNRRLLGLSHGIGQEIEQIAMAGVGAGVFRGAGEAVGAGVRAGVRAFRGRVPEPVPDPATAMIGHEADEVIGPSPFGESRVAKGVHRAEVLDAIRRFDTPDFLAPTDRNTLLSSASIPTLAARESDGMFTATGNDAFFVGTSNPLKDVIVRDIPALRASASIEDRAVVDHFADLNSRVAINDVKETAIQARLDDVTAKATPAETVSQMLNDLAATNKRLAELEATTEAAAPRHFTAADIAAARKALGREGAGTELFPRELSADEVAKLQKVPVIRDRLRVLGVADKPRKLSAAEVDQLREALNPSEEAPAAPSATQSARQPAKKSKAAMREIKKLRATKAALETNLAKAQAVAADVRGLTAARDTVVGQGNDMRLQRARLVAQQARKRPAIGAPAPSPDQAALIRDLLSNRAPTLSTRVAATPEFADALDAAQKALDDREVQTPKVIAPEIDEATGKPREGAKETVDIGQKGPPVDLDHEIAVGVDDEGNPVMTTLRAMLEDMKDDDDLVKAMRECLV